MKIFVEFCVGGNEKSSVDKKHLAAINRDSCKYNALVSTEKVTTSHFVWVWKMKQYGAALKVAHWKTVKWSNRTRMWRAKYTKMNKKKQQQKENNHHNTRFNTIIFIVWSRLFRKLRFMHLYRHTLLYSNIVFVGLVDLFQQFLHHEWILFTGFHIYWQRDDAGTVVVVAGGYFCSFFSLSLSLSLVHVNAIKFHWSFAKATK